MLGNPVDQVYIRPPGSPIIIGDFRVTSTFAEHVASGRGPGIDIGNSRCGDPILSVGRFKITEAFKVNSGPYIGTNVVRYDLLDYPGAEFGMAHMPSLETSVGITGPRGVAIGHIGGSGGVPCHLHGGLKINGIETDWWPLLDQNEEVDMLQGTFVARLYNKTGNIKNDKTRFRSAPFVKTDNILKEFMAGNRVDPDFIVAGTMVGPDPNWYGLWSQVPSGALEFGYVHNSTVGALSAIESSGVPQAKYDADVAAAFAQGRGVGADAVAAAAETEAKKY